MEERLSRRKVVDIDIRASAGGQSVGLSAYDLSVDGCMMEGRSEPLPPPGSQISLALPEETTVTGMVVWTRMRFGGVKFDEPIDSSLVDRLGFKPEPILRVVFKDRFGRPLTLPGERFRLARDGT